MLDTFARIIRVSVIALALSGQASASDCVRVIDGDTIAIGHTTYRLFGIDAPEAGQSCAARGGTWKCGDAATEALVRLVGDAVPVCDDRGVDLYDRTLAVCFANGLELNETMVALGLAWAFRRSALDFVEAEDVARRKTMGIWQSATETPWAFRERMWQVAVQDAPKECPVKGNISSNGHVCHAPWSPWYTKTKVTTSKGERWFCSEREALVAGWRAPIWGH